MLKITEDNFPYKELNEYFNLHAKEMLLPPGKTNLVMDIERVYNEDFYKGHPSTSNEFGSRFVRTFTKFLYSNPVIGRNPFIGKKGLFEVELDIENYVISETFNQINDFITELRQDFCEFVELGEEKVINFHPTSCTFIKTPSIDEHHLLTINSIAENNKSVLGADYYCFFNEYQDDVILVDIREGYLLDLVKSSSPKNRVAIRLRSTPSYLVEVMIDSLVNAKKHGLSVDFKLRDNNLNETNTVNAAICTVYSLYLKSYDYSCSSFVKRRAKYVGVSEKDLVEFELAVDMLRRGVLDHTFDLFNINHKNLLEIEVNIKDAIHALIPLTNDNWEENLDCFRNLVKVLRNYDL